MSEALRSPKFKDWHLDRAVRSSTSGNRHPSRFSITGNRPLVSTLWSIARSRSAGHASGSRRSTTIWARAGSPSKDGPASSDYLPKSHSIASALSSDWR